MSTNPERPIEFDLSQFHPLDHEPWEIRVCRSYYGGIRRHLALDWEYRTGLSLRQLWHRQISCRFDHHDMQPYWRGRGILYDEDAPATGYMCANCLYKESPH